jgi:hypothetical protein
MRIFASLIAVLFALNLSAQSSSSDSTFPRSTQEISSFLKLNTDQVAKLESIAIRKSDQIDEISNLKSTDLELYINKRNAINKGFITSIELMLEKGQRAAFKAYENRIRLRNQEIRSNLSKSGKSEQEIKLAIVEN